MDQNTPNQTPEQNQQPIQPPVVDAAPVQPEATPVFSIIALVCGICSLVFSWAYIGYPLGIAAIIFGVIGKKKGKANLANIGLILGIVGLVLSVILTIVMVVCAAAVAATYGSY